MLFSILLNLIRCDLTARKNRMCKSNIQFNVYLIDSLSMNYQNQCFPAGWLVALGSIFLDNLYFFYNLSVQSSPKMADKSVDNFIASIRRRRSS